MQNIESPPATSETRERNGRGMGGRRLVWQLSQRSHQGDWVGEAGRGPWGGRRSAGARPEGPGRSPRGRPTAARTPAFCGWGLFGVSLPASSRSHSCFGGRASPLSFFTRRALPEATREKRGPSWSARNGGGATGRDDVMYVEGADAHAALRMRGGPSGGARRLGWSVWRPSAKLSCPRTCCAWRCGDARDAGRAAGVPGLPGVVRAEAAGVWGHSRGPGGPPALAVIHSLSACSALGTGNRIINPSDSLLKPAVG